MEENNLKLSTHFRPKTFPFFTFRFEEHYFLNRNKFKLKYFTSKINRCFFYDYFLKKEAFEISILYLPMLLQE